MPQNQSDPSPDQLSRSLLKFLLKRTGGDMEIAREVLQDTWASALKSLATFRRKSTLFTWICKIALYKLADYYRHNINRHSLLVVPLSEKFNDLVDPRLTPPEQLAIDELVESVKRALALIPPQYRQLLKLKFYENLSHKDISIKLNISKRSAEGLLYRAKHNFKKAYTAVDNSPPRNKKRPIVN